MKMAVTGASGFVGRHVVRELLARGTMPVLLTRDASVLPDKFTSCRVAGFDLTTNPPDAFDQLGRPDVLIHLAWGGLPHYKSRSHFEDELPAHYRFLKTLVACGLKKIVVAGTCLEYGMQSGCLREDTRTLPHTPYGFAKDALRQQLQFLQSEFTFDLVWARLFYMFGDGQSPASLLPLLQKAIETGEPTFPMSAGEQLRDYQPVESSARSLVKLALDPSARGVYNVCAGKPTSVRTLVEGWIRDAGSPITPEFGRYPYPDYEPMAFWGDATRINELITS
jgi:nucleoside-diphosphate-sugar epimerase